jgi:hypothetical protein
MSDIVEQHDAAMGAYIEVRSIVQEASERIKQDKGCN